MLGRWRWRWRARRWYAFVPSFLDDHRVAVGILAVEALKGCGGDVDLVDRIHTREQCGEDPFVSSTLVSVYCKCGSLGRARDLLFALTNGSSGIADVHGGLVVAWTAIIFGYAKEDGGGALQLLATMQLHGIHPNARTFVAAIKACSSLLDRESFPAMDKDFVVARARAIQQQAVSSGYGEDLFLSNTLVDFYAKAGLMVEARRVFEGMTCHTLVSWNALLLGCVENGADEVVLDLFSAMQRRDGFVPDDRSFLAAVRACTAMAVRAQGGHRSQQSEKVAALDRGMELHSQAAALGCDFDIFVAGSLVEMYSKCGSLSDSRRVFDRAAFHDVVLWTALLSAYVENGEARLTLELFSRMTCEPNSRTSVVAVKACTQLALREAGKHFDGGEVVKLTSLEWGFRVHSDAAKRGLDSDWYLASSLVDMYSRCGSMVDARRMFDKIHIQTSSISNNKSNTPCWNSLLLGYVDHGKYDLALHLYESMTGKDFPDARTFSAALKACAGLAALEAGRMVTAAVYRSGLESDGVVSTCLVDFHAKSGSMTGARHIFDACCSTQTDLVSWTALVAGYSRQGDSGNAEAVFQAMQKQGLFPDNVSFVCILTACSHTGLVESGKSYFKAMLQRYGMEPSVEHYQCLVDLLGRANRMEEAVRVVRGMPAEASGVMWMIVLAACKKWRNVEMARVALDSLLEVVGDGEAEMKDAACSLMLRITPIS